jgi:hypothetical protein
MSAPNDELRSMRREESRARLSAEDQGPRAGYLNRQSCRQGPSQVDGCVTFV